MYDAVPSYNSVNNLAIDFYLQRENAEIVSYEVEEFASETYFVLMMWC